MIRLLLVSLALPMLASCNIEPTPPCEDDVMAFVMAEGFIRDSLKSPSTAEFASITDPEVRVSPTFTEEGQCAFLIVHSVDAQNSFGAMLRQKYAITVIPDATGDSWKATGLRAMN